MQRMSPPLPKPRAKRTFSAIARPPFSAATPWQHDGPVSPFLPAFPLQAKLTVSQPHDPLEREADRVANQVSRMPAAAVVQRKCQKCSQDDKDRVLRKADASPSSGALEPSMDLGPGAPLDSATRQSMEASFGWNFGAVTIHTGPPAREAARALGAEAFTFGPHIAFGEGKFVPHTPWGRQLLAHELTHVIQQGHAAEYEGTEEPALVHHRTLRPQIARRGPMVRLPVRPIPLRQPPRAGTGAVPRGEQAPREAPYHQLYAPPPEWDNSMHALRYRASVARTRDEAIFDAEIPVVTLERGGSPPRFITTGREQSMIGEGWSATYTPHAFHILDALEHEIGRASSHEALEVIVGKYLSDTWLGRTLLVSQMGRRQRHFAMPSPVFIPFYRWPENFDPQGEERLRVYAAAVATRIEAAPELRSSPLAAPYADILLPERVEQSAGPCHVQHVPRLGGHRRHNEFAEHVTGSRQDFQIETPEGISCVTDGLDSHNQAWEVKTGYRYFSDYGIIWSLEHPNIVEGVGRLEEQRARCLYVTARCGYPYAYAFDREDVASFMQTQWSNLPPVFYIEPPYSVDE